MSRGPRARTLLAELQDAPSGVALPPARPLVDELPLTEMPWPKFEKLCCTLAGLEGDCEDARLYGKEGSRQEGIDILARVRGAGDHGKYIVYQCKRYKTIKASDVAAVVAVFRKGTWRTRATTLVLFTSADVRGKAVTEEFVRQQRLLHADGIALRLDGPEQICSRLRGLPLVVERFFGPGWPPAFCVGAKDGHGTPPRTRDLPALRAELRSLYLRVFAQHDPWIVAADTRTAAPALLDRYVPPGLVELAMAHASTDPDRVPSQPTATRDADLTFGNSRYDRQVRRRASASAHMSRATSLEACLASAGDTTIVVGAPGAGKSTVLRAMALDALSATPRLTPPHWQQKVPLWVSFHNLTSRIEHHASGTSVLSTVVAWLADQGSGDLASAVEDALVAGDAVLLVDGLDEASSVAAGETAIARIGAYRGSAQTFATSRPNEGFLRSLGDAQTRTFEIAPLLDVQRRELARRVLAHLDLSRQGQAPTDLEVERATRGFLAALRASSFGDLSATPLFLLLLADAWHREESLPASRSDVLHGIVAHLLGVHSRRRLKAASVSASSEALEADEMRKALECLAWTMLGEARYSIERSRARQIVASHLSFLRAISPDAGHALAEVALARGPAALPLLVERSDTEIGFIHRVFQDYLASSHAREMPADSCLELFSTKLGSRRWTPVLAHIAERASESSLRAIVTELLTPSNVPAAAELLADLACGASWFPPDSVEASLQACDWLVRSRPTIPSAKMIVRSTVRGLARPRARSAVRPLLKRWLPDRFRWAERTTGLLLQYAPPDEIARALAPALLDTSESEMMSAARTLGQLAQADQSIVSVLRKLVDSPRSPVALAGALHALALSNVVPGYTPIPVESLESQCDEVRVVGYHAYVRAGLHHSLDPNPLLRIASAYVGAPFQQLVVDTLVAGWPTLDALRLHCLSGLRNPMDRDEISFGSAAAIAARLFATDSELQRIVVDALGNHRDGHVSDEVWSLAEAIPVASRSAELVAAAESVALSEHRMAWPHLYNGARVARTASLREAILKRLKKQGSAIWWDASTLVAVWGADDVGVRDALRAVFHSGPKGAAEVALSMAAVEEAGSVVATLVDALVRPECIRPDLAIRGLAEVAVTSDHAAIAGAYFSRLRDEEVHWDGAARHALIAMGIDDPRIRIMALEECGTPWGAVGAALEGYGSEREVWRAALESLAPLPDELRYECVQHASGLHGARELLSEIWSGDVDPDVRAAAAVACVADGDDQDVELLRRELHYSGYSAHTRRQAAVAGLIVRRRLELFRDAVERGSERKPLIVLIERGMDASLVLTKHLVAEWSYVREVLGPAAWERFAHSGDYELSFWETLAPFIESNGAAVADSLEVASRNRSRLGPNMLDLVAREKHQDSDFRNVFLGLLRPRQAGERVATHEQELAAAAAVATYYGRDRLFRAEAEAMAAFDNSLAVFVVATAWPQSERLVALYDEARREQLQVSGLVRASLIAAAGPSEHVAHLLRELVGARRREHAHHGRAAVQLLSQRVRRDSTLRDILMGWLDPATPSRFVSAAMLLEQAGHVTDALVESCTRACAEWTLRPLAPLAFDVSTWRLVVAATVVEEALLGR